MKEVKRILRPGGMIHILDVAADDLFISWIDEKIRAREREHVKFYSTREYAGMFSRIGLNHIKSSRIKIFYPVKVHVSEKNS